MAQPLDVAWGLRLLESLAPFGRAYLRVKYTEYWLGFKLGEFVFQGTQLFRKWRALPLLVQMLNSDQPAMRLQAVQEMEKLSHRYTHTRAFSLRCVEQGSLPGLLATLHSDVPGAVSAALCVLCDVYAHPKCAEELDDDVLKQVFMLTGGEDLFCRLRASLFLALLATEPSVEEKLRRVVLRDTSYLKQLTRMIRKPLPDRFQNVLENLPNPQQDNDPSKYLKVFKGQLRKAAVTVLLQVLQAEQLLEALDFAEVAHVVRAVRDKDAGLRTTCRSCLKLFAKKEEGRRIIGDYAVRYWAYLVPTHRDMDCLALIEELGTYPDLRERFIQDGFIFHRLPVLLTSRKVDIMTMAFRCLFPFTMLAHHRWKLVKAGILPFIVDGIYNKNRSVHVAAIICLSQLCVSQEVYLAIQAEFSERSAICPRVGEYLIYLALCYPEEALGHGSLRLLEEVAPRLKSLPKCVFKKLATSLVDGNVARQTESARLIREIGQIEKFRDTILDTSIVTDILLQMKNGPSECKAAMIQALTSLSEDDCVAKRVGTVKGLVRALWHAQDGVDDELAIAALELLRVLSKTAHVSRKDICLGVPSDSNHK